MAVATLYRRVLPSPPAIEFTSSEGKQLFTEALRDGTMEGFFKLISHFQTQSEPAYCGLASLSVVLNALAIDPGRNWKGPWRWFDESMLDCCEPLDKVKAEGISFGKVACLAHCAGAKVEALRANKSSIDDFRKHLIQCASFDDCHLIVSYNRRIFKQTGTGHFSPIGGYHAGRDMALILDVARFKYPPHWVPVSLLWEAMNTVDEATGLSRGFMLISKLQNAPSLLFMLSCRHENWTNVAKFLIDDIPILLKSEDLRTVSDILSAIFVSLPSNAGDFIKWMAEVRRKEENGLNLSKEEKGRLAMKEELMQLLRETRLFKLISDTFASPCCSSNLVSSCKGSLSNIAASVCCQGVRLLNGNGASKEFSCSSTCVKCFKSNGDMPRTVVSTMVVSNGNEQGVDILVPMLPQSNGCHSCSSTNAAVHPDSNDVLTVLLLALPPSTWSGIKKESLLKETYDLVSTESLPNVLQEEVLHLRRQLYFLKKCKDNKVDDDLYASSF